MRYLRTTQALIERGMDLAHEAADQATYVMQSCPPGPSTPTSAAAAIERAEARARQHHPNYGTVFAQLARSVRQSIALQAHIADRAPWHATTQAATHAAPRETHAAETPDSTTLRLPKLPRMDAAERPDWAVRTDPDGQIPFEHLLQEIRADLGLPSAPPADLPHPKNPQTRHPEHAGTSPEPRRNWRPPGGPKPSG